MLLYRGHRYRLADALIRKGDRLRGVFHGQADGTWYYDGDYTTKQDVWYAALGLINGTLAVEGATEHHTGFRAALIEMAAQYPELLDLLISFDGPRKPLKDLLAGALDLLDWAAITFYHGTSTTAWRQIQQHGLRPRRDTGVNPAYGKGSSAPESDPTTVYLTTQIGMARFAARDAAGAPEAKPLVLEVDGSALDPTLLLADADSQAEDAVASLAKLGSVRYRGTIPPGAVRPLEVLRGGEWVQYREAKVAASFVWTGWTCVSDPSEFVDWLVNRGQEIDFAEFARQVEIESLPLDESRLELLPTDWSVTFLKTELPSGRLAYVMQHSGIEHLCLPLDQQEFEEERALAGAMIDWMDETFDPAATWKRTEAEIAAARKHFFG